MQTVSATLSLLHPKSNQVISEQPKNITPSPTLYNK